MSKITDIELIKKGMSYAFSNNLRHILKKIKILEKVSVISFDNNNIYSFQYNNGNIFVKEIPHNENIIKDSKKGWSAYLRQKEDLSKYIPKEYLKTNIISGGLFTDFSKIQKEKSSIYTTAESYISTLIHEYAHIYFNTLNPFYFNNREYNLRILNYSKKLYSQTSIDGNTDILLPSNIALTEIFAFCTEYEFAKKYAKKYYKELNERLNKNIDELIQEEENKDLTKEDSVLNNTHILSFVLGKILLEKYPDDWYYRLLQQRYL